MFKDLFKNRKVETQTIPKETLNLGLFPIESKTTTQTIIEPTGEEPLGLIGPLAVGKQIQEAIARSGASAVLTATRQKQLTSEELPGWQRTFKEIVFGKEALKPIEQRVAETEISLAREGLPIIGKPELVVGKEKFLAPIGVLGTIALDFTGWGGGRGQVLKLLAKTNKIEEVSNILRKIGVAEDLIGDYSKVIAETTKVDDVVKTLNRIEEIQKTTKIVSKIAPVAQKGLPEAISSEKGIMPKELQPLAQEARKILESEKPLSVQWLTSENRVSTDWFRNGKELENFIKTNPENKLVRVHQTETFGMGAKVEKTLFDEAKKPVSFTDFYNQAVKGVKEVKPEVPVKAPIKLYHGTESSVGAKIDKEGLRYGDFLTSNEQEALDYAQMRAKQKGTKPIVKEFEFAKNEVEFNPSTNEWQYRGGIEKLKGKYPASVYRAYNDYFGSNLTAKQIDLETDVGKILEAYGDKKAITDFYTQAVKGVGEVKPEISIPARPSTRLAPQVQAVPGEVAFRPGRPIHQTKTQPELPRQATKILKSDSLSTQYHKVGEESSVIREVDKSLTPGTLDIQKGGLYGSFKNSMENRWTNVREFIQDDWYRVKKLVDNKNWTTEGLDPYQREILFRGRVGARIEEAVDEIVRIDRQIVNSSKSLGIKDSDLLEEVNSYLISKHAPERNLRLGDGAAGITTKEANETLSILKESSHFDTIEKISKQISDLNKRTLEVLKEGQVIDKETYDLLNKIYKNHIPLNRVFEENEDIVQVLMNKGLDVKWSGLRRAVGSERKVSDILTNVAMNYEQAIIRAEKNLVDLSTLKFARENNYMGGLFSEIKLRAIGKTFDDKIILEKITDPSVLALREGGKAVYLKINDLHLAIALRGINRYKVDGIMRGVQVITRWFSSLATRFNPEFAIPNKIRDLQEAIVYAASKREIGLKSAPKLVVRDLKSQKDVLDYLRGADTEGARLYKQMKMDGGTTGGMALSTRQQLEIDISKIRKINRSNPRKVVSEIVNKVDQWNMLFEDSTRLSIYKEALAKGATRERAAVMAKEGTINFNKMGRGGPVINALYMFSNASIQGSAKMLTAMKNPKVATAVVGSVGVAVASIGEWNDRVDPDWRDKVSKWDRMNGLPIILPSTDEKFNYITIPVSWGIKPIKVSMDYFYDLTSGKAKNLEEVASGIFASFIEAYNPIGGTDFTSAITPTIFDLPVDLAKNKKWSGSKIRPDYSAYTPDSLNYFDSLKDTSTGKFFVETTDNVSEKTGGRVEVSPADVNYAYQQLIGGAGRFISKTTNTILSVKNQKLSSKEIPFVSRFYRSIPTEETGKAGKESEEIKKILTEQSRERIEKTQEAEAYYEELKKMPREQAKEVFNELIKEDKKLAEKINDIISEEKLGLTYTERLIKQLGIENGERARFLFNQLNQLKTQKEKREYYKNLIDKKIITKQVGKQIEFLLKQ